MTNADESRPDVPAIKRQNPLVEVVRASGVRLRPTGPRRWQGLCPFHQDRRPSLLVDEADEHFHCFGCGAHGDVIDFVRRREGLGFAEACRRLSGIEGTPQRRPAAPDEHDRRWEDLSLAEQVVMNAAAAVYQHCLSGSDEVKAYLAERAVPEWVVRACGLGYADGRTLAAELGPRAGLSVAYALGLLRPAARAASGQPRETLAGRIVVPELRGSRCLWFIGRSLAAQSDRPKYLALGGRRPVLGLERAAGRREVFLCEGVFDYLTAVAWGLPAFSSCGTHLPAERLQFLASARVIYGVLDGDDAGRAAAARFATVLGPRWRPLSLPEGCDLNDLARRPGGRAEFFRLLTEERARGEGQSDG